MPYLKEKEARELYRKFGPPIFRTAFRILCTEKDAEDVMQNSLIKFITGKVRTENDRMTYGWLRKTCIRECMDILRKRNRMTFIDDGENTVTCRKMESGPFDMERNDMIPLLLKALSSMKDEYRLILNLHLIEEMGYKEISEILNISESGVRSKYMRARQKLAELIKSEIS